MSPSEAVLAHTRSLSPARAALALVAGLALLHLAVAGRFGLGVDEAHYALFGLVPDWSYFDHPPMVGWMQALAIRFSYGEFALRLWPVLLSVAAAGLLWRLTLTLFPEGGTRLALAAVLLLESAVMFQLVSLALVPELPLLVFALGGALFLFRAVQGGRQADWLGVGLCFGLAGLSKYTAVMLVVGALLWLVLERRLDLLKGRGPWLAALVALSLVTPVLAWNAQHDWISFAYQLGHGAPDRDWSALRSARSLAAQVLAYTPGVILFGTAAVLAARREWGHAGVRFSLALALPLLLLFGWGAGFEETLPHWTLLGWALLAPLTARWVLARWDRRAVRLGTWGSAGYSVLLVGLLHLELATPVLPFPAGRYPLADLYGWQEAARRAVELRRTLPGTRLFVGNWSWASRIAWYAREPVQVADQRFDQFDLWFGTPQRGDDALLVVPAAYDARPDAAGLSDFFRCHRLDSLTALRGAVPVNRFHFYECRDYRG